MTFFAFHFAISLKISIFATIRKDITQKVTNYDPIAMCTFHFSLNDAEVNRIRPNRSVHLSDDVAWFKNHPVKLTSEDMDERTKYILER